MRKSTYDLFGEEISVDLLTALNAKDFPLQGLHKTRIAYDTEIRAIEFSPYTIRPIQSLKLIHDDSISYDYKFLDRSTLDHLYAQRHVSDDILIVKNGCVTDTYYANIIFRLGNVWHTPRTCLLNGTMRQYLMDAGLITEADINTSNLFQYQSSKLINAMLGMDGPEIPVNSIA